MAIAITGRITRAAIKLRDTRRLADGGDVGFLPSCHYLRCDLLSDEAGLRGGALSLIFLLALLFLDLGLNFVDRLRCDHLLVHEFLH